MSLSEILTWLFPMVDFVLVMVCFSMLPTQAGRLLGVGFIFALLSNLSWPIADIVYRFNEVDLVYEVNSYLSLVLYIVAGLFMVLGIIRLAEKHKQSVN